MLGVRLIQADLSSIGGASRRSWDPFAVVKCEKTKKFSKAVNNVSGCLGCKSEAMFHSSLSSLSESAHTQLPLSPRPPFSPAECEAAMGRVLCLRASVPSLCCP